MFASSLSPDLFELLSWWIKGGLLALLAVGTLIVALVRKDGW